jgi:signal transduction histidine kinase
VTRSNTALLQEADIGPGPSPVTRWLTKRPRIADGLLVVLCAASQWIAVLVAATPQTPWTYTSITLSSLGLLGRRRFPLIAVAMVTLVMCIGPVVQTGAPYLSLPVAFALYSVAARSSLSRAAIGYGIGVGLPILVSITALSFTGTSFSPTVLDPFALLALTLGIAVRGRRERLETVTMMINHKIENARVMERAQITAEMHDIVAHSLSVMIALADGASAGWQKHPERSARALENLSTTGRTALLDMQRILHLLRDSDADLARSLHQSGHNLPHLEELIEVFRTAGLPVSFTRTGETLPDDPALTTTIYRIVQECLTNALRYAVGANRVHVGVAHDNDDVDITVVDDGRADPTSGSSLGARHGLVGIQERAAAYAGTSTAGPLPGGGWRVHVTLPTRDGKGCR